MRSSFHDLRGIAGTLFILTALLTTASGSRTFLDGLIWDLSVATRARLIVSSHPSDVVVVALDAESLEQPDLAQVPRVLFAPHWATLLSGLTEARAIGFDIIFAYSANRLIPSYERDFLAALAQLKSRVVLARSLATLPADPYLFAVDAFDGSDGVASVELREDSDGVIRRVFPDVLSQDGTSLPSFAAALLRRAGGPALDSETALLPPRHPEGIRTYALVDVLRCIQYDKARAQAIFAGKIVLVGTTLRDEERKTTSARFMPYAAPTERDVTEGTCRLTQLAPTDPEGGTVPGVHVHAAATEAAWHGFSARPAGRLVVPALVGAVSSAGFICGLALPPIGAAAALLTGLAALFVVQFSGAAWGFWIPVGAPMLALIAAVPFAFLVRSILDDRLQRRLRSAFARYLAPTLVDAALSDESGPRPGGRLRELTVMFADLSGYTSLSDRIKPDELVAITNTHLGIMADEIEAAGGYVDKFIGDAVMAIWNAPSEDPDHALHAVRAALRIRERIAQHAEAARGMGHPSLSVKISLNTGEAVVGNVGSARKLNYTAIGRTINLAARLERAGEEFGCAIVMTEATMQSLGGHNPARRLGPVTVRGMTDAVMLFEPLAAPTNSQCDVGARRGA